MEVSSKETIRKLDLVNAAWKNRRSHVKEFIRRCPICQKLKITKEKQFIPPYTLSADGPMKRINVDSLGPFKEDEDGYCYVLAIIDTFTRFVQLHKLKDVSAKPTAEILLQHVSTFGCPRQILTDNGSQFANNIIISELLTLLGTEHQTSIAYSHQENAIVERVHRETLRHLRALLFDRYLEDKWSTCLPLVQRILNSKEHESTGISPVKLLFGDNIDLDENIFVPEEREADTSSSSKSRTKRQISDLSTYVNDLVERQDKLNKLARTHLEKRDSQQHTSKFTHPATEYAAGTYVLYTPEWS